LPHFYFHAFVSLLAVQQLINIKATIFLLNPVREITSGIKVKLSEASFRAKITTNMVTLERKPYDLSATIGVDAQSDINVRNDIIYTDLFMKMTSNIPNKPKEFSAKIDCIHSTNGKELKMNFSIDGKQIEPNEENKKQMSNYIKDLFGGLGKNIKTGDVLKYVNFSNGAIQKEIPEIVKGIGFYKDKNVLVTEYSINETFHPSGSEIEIMDIRAKGYNLYDAETFIPVFGESVFYINTFNQKSGTLRTKMNTGCETYVLQVRNILDLPSPTNGSAGNKSPKPSWSEASEKIKALGELLQKGLISQEEYEEKKKILLQNF
jgi:hypothetical protein